MPVGSTRASEDWFLVGAGTADEVPSGSRIIEGGILRKVLVVFGYFVDGRG